VRASLVVVPHPRAQGGASVRRCLVRAGVGPLALERLNEALGLAIRAGRVRARAEVAEARWAQ
jgi:hypothetical protein